MLCGAGHNIRLLLKSLRLLFTLITALIHRGFKKRDFSSPTPTAERYRRMNAAYEPIRAKLGVGRDLGVDQIVELLKVER